MREPAAMDAAWADTAGQSCQVRSFDYFFGSWDVRRTIFDRLAKATYRFEGVGTVSQTSFVETGLVHWGATSLKGERSYGLRLANGALDILFPDGRLFVTIGDGPMQLVYHLCGDDHYAGRFYFEADGGWAEAWRVKGPRKNYASLARYRRSAA
jgi:hypothetical protein